MGYWGKIIGGTAGFFVGGPYGAVIGAALGHAADSGSVESIRRPFLQATAYNPARVAGMLGRREEVFAITVTVMAAKLCKCDGPITRLEIDAFKRNFRIPPASARGIGGCSTRLAIVPIRSNRTPHSWRKRLTTIAACLNRC
jgi:DnaJ like chaperone protein